MELTTVYVFFYFRVVFVFVCVCVCVMCVSVPLSTKLDPLFVNPDIRHSVRKNIGCLSLWKQQKMRSLLKIVVYYSVLLQSLVHSFVIDPITPKPGASYSGLESKMASDRIEGDPHIENLLFIECGFGNDSHGQNATKAAGTLSILSVISYN